MKTHSPKGIRINLVNRFLLIYCKNDAEIVNTLLGALVEQAQRGLKQKASLPNVRHKIALFLVWALLESLSLCI